LEYAMKDAILDVYGAATSLLQPGGLMSGLICTDMTTKVSDVADQVIPALASSGGLLSAVRNAKADHLLKHFAVAAVRDTLQAIAVAGAASSDASTAQ
jgi:hypothetical protein